MSKLKLAVKTVDFDGDEVYLVKVLEQDDREFSFRHNSFDIKTNACPSIDADDEEIGNFYARGLDKTRDNRVCCTNNKLYIEKLKKAVKACNKENSSDENKELNYEIFE